MPRPSGGWPTSGPKLQRPVRQDLLRLGLLLPLALLAAPSGAEVLRPPASLFTDGARLTSPPPLRPPSEGLLFAQLDAGDRSWLPRLQRLPGGGARYVYRRRSGEPPLTLPQIRALLLNPPSYHIERRAIRTLLAQLRHLGVSVRLQSPRKPAAAGEWHPGARVIRIRPDVPNLGSRDFAKVLNHEAIHVAQSCRGGGGCPERP